MRAECWAAGEVTEAKGELMQEKKFWTLVALAGLAAVTLVRSERDLDGRAASRPVRTLSENNATVSSSSSVSASAFAATSPHARSAWLVFRADWGAVLWRV